MFIFLLITVTWIKWRNLISWFFNNNEYWLIKCTCNNLLYIASYKFNKVILSFGTLYSLHYTSDMIGFDIHRNISDFVKISSCSSCWPILRKKEHQLFTFFKCRDKLINNMTEKILPVDSNVHELKLGSSFDPRSRVAFHSFRCK